MGYLSYTVQEAKQLYILISCKNLLVPEENGQTLQNHVYCEQSMHV